MLQQYDTKLKLVANGNISVDKSTLHKWEMSALDKFMTECGDATKYTATVSQYFTIPELICTKRIHV